MLITLVNPLQLHLQLHLPHVLIISLPSLMGTSTMVVDPLTTDLKALWPPTPVTLATLSMEAPPPGLVGVMECGVGQLQCVRVSAWNGLCIQFLWYVECSISHTANCLDLPSLINGMIMYSAGSSDNRPFGSSAVHSCDTGYTLTGGTLVVDTTRFCVPGGIWGGSPPTCQGK